jgi:hypothetical protein
MLCGLFVATASAGNVDLSTIPPREGVQLTIYNSEDLTLVRDTRTLPFKKGVNPLQFSWANTLIDPTSVDIRFVSHGEELDLLDTTFPHDKPQMLYWNVRSDFDGDAQVEITYFTSGISWSADYVCITDVAEERMSFEGFVRITNNSGEDYPNASVRMVVGTINLVEKIADLARRGMISQAEAKEAMEGRAVRDMAPAARKAVGGELKREFAAAGLAAAPKEIEKQGLSEYFIFTVPGTETVQHTWSKRMRLFEGLEVPFRIQYRFRPQEYGHALVRLFLLRNDKASKLGESPLPDGIVRLFRRNGQDGLSILVTQMIKYIPIGQEIVLNLGPDPEVIHELIRLGTTRENIWFQRAGANVFFNPGQGHRIEINDTVAGWDERAVFVERIRNYRAKAIDVEIRRAFPGHVDFISGLDPVQHDFRTVQFTAKVAPGEKKELRYELLDHQGHNHKQERVIIVAE